MHIPTEAANIEKALGEAKVSVQKLLDDAGIDRSTWTRWRNGSFQPRLAKWVAVKEAADRLLREAAA